MGVIGSLALLGTALMNVVAIGLAAFGATSAMARQPEVQGRAFTVFILASAFTEALGLIGFVVTLIS